MAQGKVVAFLRSLPGQTIYWLPGQLMANSKLYQPEQPLHKKFDFFFRRKALWEMVALSATICGIEFCYSAETAFVSPVLRLLGTPTYFTSMVWGCSPILGVFITPLFGSLSDACNSKFGRRRPFIVVLSLVVLAGLALIASAVSVAQKTEAKIMSGYYVESQDKYSRDRRALTEPPDLNFTTLNTTTWPVTPWATARHNPEMNMAEAFGFNGEKTTKTPPTSAAVHQLPIGMAILGVILLDFGCDASQSPCRTYLLDVCLPEDHQLGLRTFTVSAGFGGTIGYLMAGIDTGVSSEDSAALFFQHVRLVYTVIGVLFILFVCSTIFVFHEPTLEEWRDLQTIANENQEAAMRELEKLQHEASNRKLSRTLSRKLQTGLLLKAQPKQPEKLPLMASRSSSDAMQQFKLQSDALEISREEVQQTKSIDNNEMARLDTPKDEEKPEEETLLSEEIDESPEISYDEYEPVEAKIAASEPKEPTFLTYLRSIRRMPRSVALVCLTNYFSWMSLVCYSLYFTDFCGEVIFDGEARAPYGTQLRTTYEQGVRFGACGMSLYSLTCCIYSLFAEKIYRRIGLRFMYALGPSMYTFGLLVVIMVQAKWAAIFLSLTAGLMYSTLFTMPYILIGKYHSLQMFEKIENPSEDPERQLLKPFESNPLTYDDSSQQQQQQQQPIRPVGEVRGLGTDIALVSSMVFLAQFTVSLTAGPLSHVTDSSIAVLIIGSAAAAMTAALSLKLYYPSNS